MRERISLFTNWIWEKPLLAGTLDHLRGPEKSSASVVQKPACLAYDQHVWHVTASNSTPGLRQNQLLNSRMRMQSVTRLSFLSGCDRKRRTPRKETGYEASLESSPG